MGEGLMSRRASNDWRSPGISDRNLATPSACRRQGVLGSSSVVYQCSARWWDIVMACRCLSIHMQWRLQCAPLGARLECRMLRPEAALRTTAKMVMLAISTTLPYTKSGELVATTLLAVLDAHRSTYSRTLILFLLMKSVENGILLERSHISFRATARSVACHGQPSF